MYTANSTEGRILLALRAGEMESHQCYERFPVFSGYVGELLRNGLVERNDENYRITPAGRAACPFRNPLLAPDGSAPALPKESVMPKGKNKPLDRDRFLTIVRAAGQSGISRKDLVIIYSDEVCERVVDRWIRRMLEEVPQVVYRKAPGVIAAVGAVAAPASALEAEVKELERQYDEFAFEIEPASAEPSMDAMANPAETSGSPVAETEPPPAHGPETFVDDLRESAMRAGVEPTYPPRIQPISEDISLIDPDAVEFAIFSSGGLDIYSDEGTVTMTAPVLRKLRAFLGLFMEPA